ncbi:hypothetical protein DMW99_17760 [Pseudomonas chlororaphis]|nr:hypothetical protein C1Y36_18720 [Pseudomonas sp. FW306-2-2C-D06C]PYC35343.1 hypothetical protein DMW99_17760 [Pseudomonas chlororaphis]
MDGLRAVFERGMLAQRPLLIRTPARSKRYMNIPACLLCSGPSVAAVAGCDRLCGSVLLKVLRPEWPGPSQPAAAATGQDFI